MVDVPDTARESGSRWEDEEFVEDVSAVVGEVAPDRFAVVQVQGSDGAMSIAAWGLAFDDGAEAVADDGLRMSLDRPDNALRLFTWGSDTTARVFWVDRPPGGDAGSGGFLPR